MKNSRSLILALIILSWFSFFETSSAATIAHDFSTQLWSETRSCTICHVTKKDLPSLTPAGARLTVDSEHLAADEVQAVEQNPSNRLCYVCHQTTKDANGEITGHWTVGGDSDSVSSGTGALPTTPTGPPPSKEGPPLPPSVGNGTFGSVCVRVKSRGAKGSDCLGCHDIHNADNPHFLSDEYSKSQNRL